MRSTHLALMRTGEPWPARRADPDRSDLWVSLSAVAIGAIPLAGYTLLGHWSEGELGLAALLLVVGLRGTALALFRRYG